MWEILGISPTSDLGVIKSAYAERLKTCHPEDDPEGFQRLHGAFQQAARFARAVAKRPPAPEAPTVLEQTAPSGGGEDEIKRGAAEAETARSLAEYLAQERESQPEAEPALLSAELYERLTGHMPEAEGDPEADPETLRRFIERTRERAAREQVEAAPRETQASLDFSALISRGLEESQAREVQEALAELESIAGDPTRRQSMRVWSDWVEAPRLQRVMDQEDFIVALCRVLTGWEDLPRSLYLDLFAAYGFYGEVSWMKDTVYEPLYQIFSAKKVKPAPPPNQRSLSIRKLNNNLITALCLLYLMGGVLASLRGGGRFCFLIAVLHVLLNLSIRAPLNRAARQPGKAVERTALRLRQLVLSGLFLLCLLGLPLLGVPDITVYFAAIPFLFEVLVIQILR